MTRTRLLKRWRKWAFVVGIFALGIPVSTAMAVRSSGSRSRLHQLASDAIQEQLGLRARFATIHLELIPLSFVAQDIVLDDPVYGRFAEAEELRIAPSLRTLLRGGIDLSSIDIRGAHVRLLVRDNQIRNLPLPEGQDDGDGSSELPFDRLNVHDSTISVHAEDQFEAELSGLNIVIQRQLQGFEVNLQTTSGWIEHQGGREELQSIEAAAALRPETVAVTNLRIETNVLEIQINDAVIPLELGETGYQGRVRARYQLEHLARLPLPEGVTLPPFEGELRVDAMTGTRVGEQIARGRIELQNTTIEQFGLGSLTQIDFEMNRERVRILPTSHVQNVHDGGRVGLDGTLELDPERGFPIDVRAELQDLSFAKLMDDLGVTENAIVEWIFNGQGRLRGQLDPLNIEGPVDLRTRDFIVTHGAYHERPTRRVIGVRHGHFVGHWSIRPDAFRFSDMIATLPRSQLRANVHLGFDNILRTQVQAEVDLRDITPLDRFPLAGRGSASVEIDGTFQDPQVLGHLAINDFLFDTFQVGHVESDAVLDPDGMAVRFPMVTAVKNDSHYRADNLYLNFRRDRFELTTLMHLDNMSLINFYRVFGFEEDERFIGYQGLARGTANVRYTNGFPEDLPSGTLNVDLNLNLPRFNFEDYAFNDGQLIARWHWFDWSRGMNGANIQVDHLQLRKGDGTVVIHGDLREGGRLDLTAVAEHLALSDIEGIGDRFSSLNGIATAIGTIGGTVDRMRAHFDVAMTNLTLAGRSLGDFRTYVRLTDQEDPWIQSTLRSEDDTHIDSCMRARRGLAQARWPADPPIQTVDGPQERLSQPMAFILCGKGLDDRLRLDLAIGRTEALPLRGSIEFDNFEIGHFLPDTTDDSRVHGQLSGLIQFGNGALRAPETLMGNVAFSELELRRDNVTLQNRDPIVLQFKQGTLVVQNANFTAPDSELALLGEASLDRGLALRLQGELDLGLTKELSSAVEDATGTLALQMNVTGPFADPELYGQITVENGAFRFYNLDPPLEALRGEVRFSQRSILFENFNASFAQGEVQLTGEASMRDQGLERYAFQIQPRGIEYNFSEGVDTTFDGDMSLSWNRGDRLPQLTGDVQVRYLEYSRPIELRSLGDFAATAVRRAFRRSRTQIRRYDPADDFVQLNLAVQQHAPFRIRNNLVDAEVRLSNEEQDFRVLGTNQRFGIRGAMELTRGQLSFQNNQFSVRRGRLLFDDDTRINPHVDVVAATDIRRGNDLSAPNWRITLHVEGSADSLQLVMRSQPDLPEQDILMLLAFGITRGELQGADAGEAFASSAALEALAAVTGVDREVQRSIGIIDDFRVTSGYSQRTGRSEPRLSIGGRIADRIRITTSTGLSEAREFRAAAEWQINNNSRFQLSYDNYNFTGTNPVGNLGLDVGFRLEFE